MKKELVIHNLFLVGVVAASMLTIITNCLVAVFVSAANSGLSMSATINPSSTITISANNVALDITPSVEGTFRSAYTTVSTYTNSTDTCTVTMTTGSTNLTSGANSIATLSSTVSEANFESDRWGFRIGSSGDYSPVALSNTIATYSQATGSTGATNNIYFASKLTPATKAGTYTDTVTFMSTCVPSIPTDISDLTYMQDFASLTSAEKATILSSMTTGQQYQLMDNRDNKSYYISKLADGNVWMTQNLDHDIVAQANYYTPQNTDIPSAWTPVRATYPTATTGTSAWCVGGTWNSQGGYCRSNYTPESYDPGNLYWNGTESDFSDWGDYVDSCDYTTNTPVCDETLNPIATYTTNAGTPTPQYHIGNFYNWNAAVAMNDTSSLTTNGQIVDQSICPAGWTLPRTGTGDDSFYALWNTYGFGSSSINGSDKIWQSPLYAVASGYWDGSLNVVGRQGYFWSPVVDDSLKSFHEGFRVGGDVFTSGNDFRGGGGSVRCILRPVASTVSGLGNTY